MNCAKQELTQVPHLAVISVISKLSIFVYEKVSCHHQSMLGFHLVGWGRDQEDFKRVFFFFTDAQGWYEGEASATFKEVPKVMVVQINALVMQSVLKIKINANTP